MKICIAKKMVGFVSSVKPSNGNYLVKMSIVDSKSAIFNKPYGFIPPPLATSIQSQNISSSTYKGGVGAIIIPIKG